MAQQSIKLLLDSDVIVFFSCPGRAFEERVNKILRMVIELESRRQSLLAQDDPSNLEDLDAFFEELGDWEDLYFAERAMEDIQAGRAKTASLEEVMKKYDL